MVGGGFWVYRLSINRTYTSLYIYGSMEDPDMNAHQEQCTGVQSIYLSPFTKNLKHKIHAKIPLNILMIKLLAAFLVIFRISGFRHGVMFRCPDIHDFK